MNTNAGKIPKELAISNIDLDRTAPSEPEFSDIVWEGDILKWLGMWQADCSALNTLAAANRLSLRHHIISFARQRKYSMGTIRGFLNALNFSLSKYSTEVFDMAWLTMAMTLPSFTMHFGTFRSFFIYWHDRYPLAITNDALQLLSRPFSRRKNKNVLSDDPEKSWLTELEYDALLRCIWDNFDRTITDAQVTLMRLLSLQYARRPGQLAHLKICDFREDSDSAGNDATRRHIHFPGAKDVGALLNFRDSKEEIHPVADHLWDLFQIQKNEVRLLVEKKLDRTINEQELAQLPIFITSEKLDKAVEVLTQKYYIDWNLNFDHQTLHISPQTVSKVLRWARNKLGDNNDKAQRPSPPLSHRTGRPIHVNATRLRHTRARQLARAGTPKHVLSFWLGHECVKTLDAYYNDPAEDARQIDEAMKSALLPLAMAFTGKLLDDESYATCANDPEKTLEFAADGNLKNVGKCGKHSFCATTSVPIPCYRCKMFEPLVYAPHEEVLLALLKRQSEENAMIRIGGNRKLLTPINLEPDIRAVQACIARCDARKTELKERNE